MIAAVSAVLGVFEKQFFRGGLEALEKRWTKCINIQGDYEEKYNFTVCLPLVFHGKAMNLQNAPRRCLLILQENHEVKIN